jgi:effector-binding domain-containing protein
MSYKCEVKEQSAQPALSIRTRTAVQDLAQVLGEAYGAIAQYLGELGEQPAGPPFTAYYNMDMQDLDVEIGFPVYKRLPGKDDIKASDIPGGKAATCLHTGPYSGIGPAYNALSQWIKDNGYEVTGVAYEVYLDDPAQTPPQELRTQILFPLKTA